MSTITILLSTYNGERYIGEQLDSIFRQTGLEDHHLKLVVRDDSSSDKTPEIVNSWKNRLDITLEQGQNVGARDSFFLLLKQAPPSDYYAFCDQDDVWYPDKLQRSIARLNAKSLYFSNIDYIGQDGNPLGGRLLSEDFHPGLKRILMCNPANGCAMVWDQAMHQCALEIPVDTFTMHDEFMCTVACLFGNLYYDPTPTMGYRIHERNVTQSNGIVKKMKIKKEIWLGRERYALDKRARALLQFNMRPEDREVLRDLADYRSGVRRFMLARSYACEDAGIERSFRLRMLLGFL